MLDNGPDGSVGPGLCEATISDDQRVVEYRVRPGIRFHNGMPVTAEDIAFSHERCMDGQPTYRSRCYDLERLEVVDERTIRFHFRTSGGTYLRTRGTYVFSRSYLRDVGEERFATHPVGTGPYQFVRFVESEFADLDAFPAYWRERPQIHKARIIFAPEDMTRVAMLQSGEADIVMAVPFPMVPELQRQGFARADANVHPTFALRFHMLNPEAPWYDRRVRLAMAHAIDQEAMVNGVFGGIPRTLPGLFPDEVGYDPELRRRAYDPALARRLLAEAGYPNGFRMPLIYFVGNYQGGRETAEVVTLFLRRIGIDVEPEGVDSAGTPAFNREHARNPHSMMVNIATAVFANYSDSVESMRFSYGSRPPNSWYRSPVFDRLVDRAIRAPTEAERAEAVRACVRQIHEDVAIIPLWNNVVVYMMREGVHFRPTNRDVPLLRLRDVTRA
ncbi:ABC transporter substrate-binding protein [Sphingosinicella terrae]|uniref:ABC transporter substrate-binding protein n=1 Tax=Sphingosinicella terrae TaxID=2172047 RepID=UPI0013B42550|nr:ABC transporter substrate-binding protein [Sphingosinicella terrae]